MNQSKIESQPCPLVSLLTDLPIPSTATLIRHSPSRLFLLSLIPIAELTPTLKRRADAVMAFKLEHS